MDERLQSKLTSRYVMFVEASLVPVSLRCVQCGICTYNCPIEIDVRRHAWLGMPISDRHCQTCGECVAHCPRGILHYERMRLFERIGANMGRG